MKCPWEAAVASGALIAAAAERFGLLSSRTALPLRLGPGSLCSGPGRAGVFVQYNMARAAALCVPRAARARAGRGG